MACHVIGASLSEPLTGGCYRKMVWAMNFGLSDMKTVQKEIQVYVSLSSTQASPRRKRPKTIYEEVVQAYRLCFTQPIPHRKYLPATKTMISRWFRCERL